MSDLDQIERFTFMGRWVGVAGWARGVLVGCVVGLGAQVLVREPIGPEPVQLTCAVDPQPCEARLPPWFPSPAERHPDHLTHRQPRRVESSEVLEARRAELFAFMEDTQQVRWASWRYQTTVEMWFWSIFLGLIGLSGAVWLSLRTRRFATTCTAVVHRHRVELGDDVVYFADLAEGDASILCHTFVDGRDGDYEGFRRAVLERIPAGRATTEVSPIDRRAIESLKR